MATFEHRICRSLETDDTINTLDFYPGPTFAVLELLDHKDSRYFAKYLRKKRWLEITPDSHKKEKTYYWTRPPDDQLRDFEDTVPDWFYISGHYARTAGRSGMEGAVNHHLPAGFFNEPFHKAEWKTELNVSDSRSLHLQTEILDETDAREFSAVMKKAWLRSPYGENAHKKLEPDATDKDAVIASWLNLWQNPQDDVVLGSHTYAEVRGVLTGQHWDNVKVVMLVGCNTLTWTKTVFSDVFPNALILGYVNKNPANGTPHIKAFMKNLFKGISDPRDPRLSDHEHIARAWMDVHRRQRLAKSNRMAYMTTDRKVFAFDENDNVVEAGAASDITLRFDNGTWMFSKNAFVVKGNKMVRSDD